MTQKIVDLLSLYGRSQLETPLSIASPFPELHQVPYSNYVALQTANIWTFVNKKNVTDRETHRINYRGPLNCRTYRMLGRVGQYALA